MSRGLRVNMVGPSFTSSLYFLFTPLLSHHTFTLTYSLLCTGQLLLLFGRVHVQAGLEHLKVPSAMSSEKAQTVLGKYGNYTWPNRQLASKIDGQIVIGALHMIHERSEDMICGAIMPDGGIQALEVMLYTIDQINKDPDFLPGITLGVLAKDDCDRDIYGLEQAVDFIRGSIANIGGSTYKCKDAEEKNHDIKIIPGVLAAPSSVTSIQVANLLKIFKISQISFFSTSTDLSNVDRFPYFFRTIPSDRYQAQVMVELVKMFNWTYVSVIYEESSYGIQGFNEVEKHLRDNGICIARTEKLLKDSGVAGTEAYDKIVDNLKLKSNARGVIIFASDQEVGELMLAVSRRNATGMFSWIGSDGWGGRAIVYENKERQVEGAITVQPLAYDVKGFKEYFLSLSPKTNKRNPWFIEYWEQHFQCKYPNSSWTPYNENYNKSCTGNEVIDPKDFHLEAQLQFVSDAAMAFGQAFKGQMSVLHQCDGLLSVSVYQIHTQGFGRPEAVEVEESTYPRCNATDLKQAMHRDLCHGKPYLCDKMSPVNGEILKQYLLKVDFQGLSGQNFTFLPNGDGPARYRILNYRQSSLNQFEWNSVGFFKDGKLTDMNMSMIQFRLEEPKHPESVCSKQCIQGQAKTFLKGHTCCWTCLNCTKYQYLPTFYMCEDCPMGTLPNLNQTHCVKIAEIYLSVDDGIAIGAMVFSSMGIVASIFVIIVFVKYSATPVVKASGRELSFVLLIGIFMCYCMTFLVVSKPNAFTCGSQQFGIGLCFAITYAAILTKTNRIARIFRAGKRTAKRPKFISPRSQLFICGSLVSLQLAIGVIWLLMSPPQAIPFYANRNDHQLICKAAQGFSYMIGLSYPIILVNICTVYAVLTRKIPEAFNESKYIGFTMYTTFIIWLAFVPIYFTTAHNIEVRMATMCFSISFSATVALVCMFTPKLYIILLHPEKNIRQSMMTSKVLLVKTNSSAVRVDSGTQSDEVEMTHRLRSSSSFSSVYSRSTSATQTHSFNGHSVSTQTLDSLGNEFDDHDVEL